MATLGKSQRFRGYDEVRRNLSNFIANYPRTVARASKAEMRIEMEESKKRTPFEFGDLRDSHVLHEPEIRGGIISVMITVGNDEINYAWDQHENLEYHHPRGGQAKFLESTLLESANSMAARVARRIDLNQVIRG
jgi:hypothetical protein